MKPTGEHPELSIVVTIYNAAAVIETLVARILKAAESIGIDFEIILVDDGSRDDSPFVMERASRNDGRVKSIFLSRNFGQQIAMSAGIQHACGNFVLIMDGDLQNPPEAIPTLYAKIRDGFDIVYCTSRVRNNGLDAATSWLFWAFLQAVMKVNIVRNQLMMRIMTAEVVRFYSMYPERIRTVAAITHDIGMKFAVIEVENEKRASGKSNYNLMKRLNLAIDVLTDLSSHPLNLLFYSGVLILLATVVASLHYLYVYFTQDLLPGFTTLVLLVAFFGSVNLISLGILARYISNVYAEVKRRPLYLVRRKLGFDNSDQGAVGEVDSRT